MFLERFLKTVHILTVEGKQKKRTGLVLQDRMRTLFSFKKEQIQKKRDCYEQLFRVHENQSD